MVGSTVSGATGSILYRLPLLLSPGLPAPVSTLRPVRCSREVDPPFVAAHLPAPLIVPLGQAVVGCEPLLWPIAPLPHSLPLAPSAAAAPPQPPEPLLPPPQPAAVAPPQLPGLPGRPLRLPLLGPFALQQYSAAPPQLPGLAPPHLVLPPHPPRQFLSHPPAPGPGLFAFELLLVELLLHCAAP